MPHIGDFQHVKKANFDSLAVKGERAFRGPCAYKTSTESRQSTTTTAIDSELVVTLQAKSYYKFMVDVFFNTANNAEGIKLGMGGTVTASSPILLRGQVFIWDDATDILGITGRLSFLNSSSVGYVTSTGNSYARIEGMLQTNAAGTFGLYWAQNTSGANNTSVSPGSNIVTMRIA